MPSQEREEMGYRWRPNLDEEFPDWFADRPIRNANPLHEIAEYRPNLWVTGFGKPSHSIEIVLVARHKLTKVTKVLPDRIVVGAVLITRHSQPRSYHRRRLGRRDNRNHLEAGYIVPVRDPLIEESAILTLHDLEATPQVGRNPATAILDAFWHEPAAIAESPVNRNRISSSKCFDDHVQHLDLNCNQELQNRE
jgi:hypothetical protein